MMTTPMFQHGLSLCVSFDLDENNKNNSNPTVYDLNNDDNDDANVPAWVRSLRDTAKSM